MARRKRRQPTKASNILPAWIWLTLGILIGLGIAMLTRTNGRYADDTKANSNSQQQSTQAVEQTKKNKFDFYTLLPELEVVIPEEETRPQKSKPDSRKPSTHSGGYLLQAGSFQQFNEADSLKARLALLGVEAHIQSVDVNNSKWHRVRIGPSNDRQALEQLRKRLRANHIETLLMQAKQ